MTILLGDVALWQKGLTLTQLRAAGIGIVNLKTSHGLTTKSVAADVVSWAQQVRTAKIGLCTFHWLDNSATGAQQAAFAFARMKDLGPLTGMAHVVDCEDEKFPATQAIYRDYVATMTGLLGRRITTYTGDWWWKPRGWAGATPWLHAAPNDGYLSGGYPGDSSTHWNAGYGNWATLSIMQYAVQPVAGIKVSLSAIREPALWAAMTGTGS